jgi:hypothetical protein
MLTLPVYNPAGEKWRGDDRPADFGGTINKQLLRRNPDAQRPRWARSIPAPGRRRRLRQAVPPERDRQRAPALRTNSAKGGVAFARRNGLPYSMPRSRFDRDPL